MRYVSASDAKQRLAVVLDEVQRDPVTIERQNKEVMVAELADVLAKTKFHRYVSLEVWQGPFGPYSNQ